MQHAAWVIAPLILIAVVGLSASTKVGKGDTLRSVIANLHLPAWVLPPWLARSIPGIEIALVVGLLSPWSPLFKVAATAALLLMLAYWALIARGLTITPRPSCGCFGEIDQPISRRTLMRNTLLVAAAGAGVALAGSGRTVWSVVSGAGTADWLWLGLTQVACAVTALVLGAKVEVASPLVWLEPSADVAADPAVHAQHVHASEVEEGDDYVRTPTPELLLHDPESGPVTLPELSAKQAQLLIFVNCYCASTTEVVALIDGWQEQLTHVDLRLVFSVPIAGRFVGNVPPGTLVDHAAVAWRRLGLEDSPSALLLGADGYLAGGPVHGIDEVREFVEDVRDALTEAVACMDGVGQE
ncbi:MauE/DoxX family redox-associated membrane protein [Knoellia sp. CPCC 206453]|uniref:MauE/DoxX family redox-associated membrane protein n=1 Tax=Knoellia pratensis TaxID=3404796 RepID=UPI003615D886